MIKLESIMTFIASIGGAIGIVYFISKLYIKSLVVNEFKKKQAEHLKMLEILNFKQQYCYEKEIEIIEDIWKSLNNLYQTVTQQNQVSKQHISKTYIELKIKIMENTPFIRKDLFQSIEVFLNGSSYEIFKNNYISNHSLYDGHYHYIIDQIREHLFYD